VIFQAQAGEGLRWRLDDEALGPADGPRAWRPTVGAHRLELLDAAGQVRARSRFEVRGNPIAGQ
jgi:penicillin-binding protein 1C